jgi:hypothetical protein
MHLRVSFVNASCKYFTSIQTHPSEKKQRLVQCTESPILFRSYGHEIPFSDQKWHRKSGIPCSGLVIVVSRARNPRVYFVLAGAKPRFVTKKGPQTSGIPCSGLTLCIFVKHLQDGFEFDSLYFCKTHKHTRTMTRRRVAFFRIDSLYFGKTFARWVYKNTRAR